MFETQIDRVQCHPAYLAVVDHWRFPQSTAVFDVATDRMTEFGQVDTNLIGTSGFQTAFQLAVLSNLLQCSKVCYRPFALCCVGGAAAQAVASIANQI